MTAKRTVSLTDKGYELAMRLVHSGRYSSLSAVLQHGLRLVEREEAEHRARLDAIRSDLARRAEQPALTTEEMDDRLAAWRHRRDSGAGDDLA